MGLPTFRTNAAGTAPATSPAAPAERKPRSNAYPGKCRKCSGWVEKGQGLLVGSRQTGWGVEHEVCPQVANAAGPQEPLFEQTVIHGAVLYDGVYTLDLGDHHRTFRLRTQSLEDDFMPGVQIIQYLSGSDNEHDYTSFGHVKNNRLTVWKRFRDSDLEKDAVRFMLDPSAAEAAVHCYRCGRELTVPASIHNGLGPECAKKGM